MLPSAVLRLIEKMTTIKEKERDAQFVGFKLGDKEFAVDIRRIIEIIYFRPITSMPEAPGFVEGVVDLRGKVITVIDLRKILKIKGSEIGRPDHILIIRLQNRMLGVIVDSVQEVLRLDTRKVQSPQDSLGEDSSVHLRGVYREKGRLIFILSMENLLSAEETRRLGPIK